MKSHVLDNLLLLVHRALGHWYVLLRLQIKLSGVRVAAAHALDRARVGLDVNDVSDRDLLLLHAVVDGRIELERLRALGRLEADEDVGNRAPVAARHVLRLHRGDLRHLSLVYLLALLDAEADSAAEVFHQDLRLLDLLRVHLGTDHGAERDLGPEVLRNAQRQGSLTRPGGTGEKESATSHLLAANELHNYRGSFASLLLADKASANVLGLASGVYSQAFDVAVRGDALRLGRGLDLLDLHGAKVGLRTTGASARGAPYW